MVKGRASICRVDVTTPAEETGVTTLHEFIDRFGGKDAYPVIEVAPGAANWPSYVIRYGQHAAVVQFMAVGEGDSAHLCIDVHPFAEDTSARAGVFGIDNGRRLEGFREEDADGSSHGWPAAAMVSVLIGHQHEYPTVRWLYTEARSARTTDGWHLSYDIVEGYWSMGRIDEEDSEIIVSRELDLSAPIEQIQALAEPLLVEARKTRR